MARSSKPTEPPKRGVSRVTRVPAKQTAVRSQAAAPAPAEKPDLVPVAKHAETKPPAIKAEPVSPPPAPAVPPVIEPMAEPVASVDVPAVAAAAVEPLVKSLESPPLSKGLTEMATAAAADKAQTVFTDLSERAKTAFEKSSKLSEEFADLTKGNLEAMAESARIAAKSAEALAQEAADYTKKSFESATAAMKRYSAVKSPAELIQLNSEFAKTSFDSAVAEASKVSETFTKMLGDFFQPLSTRYSVASEKLKAAAF